MVTGSALKAACNHCSLFQLCLPVGIDARAMDKLGELIHRRPPVEKGAYIYRAGDPFKAVYAVRSGSVKTYSSTRDGREQVTGFHLAGELLGLDAINSGIHPCSARALETTSYCEIPLPDLDAVSRLVPGLQRQLVKVMSKELFYEHSLLTVMGKRNSLERVAAFLVSIGERYRSRRFSATEFVLSMSRDDIGNYLGLAMETVSRTFAKLQDFGVIQVDGRHVRILDIVGLKDMANQATLARTA